jgi:hypothetical protein
LLSRGIEQQPDCLRDLVEQPLRVGSVFAGLTGSQQQHSLFGSSFDHIRIGFEALHR